MELSILIPAYNEADAITETITQLQTTFDALDVIYEIIVINDGSADATVQRAIEAGAQVVSHPTNGGYGRALKTGMRHARYDWIAIIDADSTYPIQQFPELMAYVPHFDMVVGARTGAHFWGGWRKRLGRLILHSMIAFVVGRPIPDANSGMRVFRKAIALRHSQRISSGFSFTTTLTLAMFLEEHFVQYVPIAYYERVGSSKVRLFWDSLRTTQIVVQAILLYNPLKLYLGVCFLAVGFGVVAGLIAIPAVSVAMGLGIIVAAVFVAILVGALGLQVEANRLLSIRTRALDDTKT